MSKKLKMTALLAVLIVILVLAIGLVACDPKTNTYKVTTQFNAEEGDVTLAPEAKDGIYNEGTMVTVSVTAKSGYEFDALTVNTDENAALNNEGKYIFKVTADTQITVLFRSVAPAACEHKNLGALVAGKAATCMEAGVIAHYHCNDCNKDLAEDKTTILESTVINIDPTAHKYGEMQNLQPATCSATGIKAHKDCELCHKHFDAEGNEIPEAELTIAKDENAHDFDVWVAEVPATCSATGTAAHKDCKLCHKHFDNDGKEIAADKYTLAIDSTAHKYGEMQQQQDATCAVAGTKAHKDCTLCQKHFSEDNVEIPDSELEIPATGKHTYDKYVSAGKEGHKVVCSVCNTPQSDTVDKHTLKINADKSKFECEQCDYEENHTHDLETESAGESGHKSVCKTEGCGYESGVTNHTLKINADKTAFECEQCDYEEEHSHDLETESVGESGHKNVCKTEGCGYESEVENHTKGESAALTKVDDNQHSYACKDCGETVKENHTYGDFQDDPENEEHYKACACGAETERAAHDIGEGDYTPDGDRHYYTCTECNLKVYGNHSRSEEPKPDLTDPATGHAYECRECGAQFDKTGHTLKWEEADNQIGKHWQKCNDCGYHTDMADCHNDSEWPKTWNAYDAQKHYLECPKCHQRNDAGDVSNHTPAYRFTDEGKVEEYCTECNFAYTGETHTFTLDENGYYSGLGKCEDDDCALSFFTIEGTTLNSVSKSAPFTKLRINSSITAIAKNAFGTSRDTNKVVQYLDIPNTVTSLASQSCSYMDELIYVNLEANLTATSSGIFSGNAKLNTFIIGEDYDCSKTASLLTNKPSLRTVIFKCKSMPTLGKNFFYKADSQIKIYFSFAVTEFDASKISTEGGNEIFTEHPECVKFFYNDDPYQSGKTEELGSYGAWHYDGDGQIVEWVKPE